LGYYGLRIRKRLGRILIVANNQDALVTWLSLRTQLSPSNNIKCIGRVDADGRIMGVVAYEGFTGASCMMHCAGEGHWLSLNFLRVIFDYPFRVCKLKVVFVSIDSSNTASINLVTKVGYKFEHRLKDAFPNGDAMVFSMRADDCRYYKEQQSWENQPRQQRPTSKQLPLKT
jgi:RimJ/RimL family protein N-acetyltransferase